MLSISLRPSPHEGDALAVVLLESLAPVEEPFACDPNQLENLRFFHG
jgi:hypothetical protein